MAPVAVAGRLLDRYHSDSGRRTCAKKLAQWSCGSGDQRGSMGWAIH